MARVVTRHFLRRRARQKAHELTNSRVGGAPAFRVVRAERGPYRWLVIRD